MNNSDWRRLLTIASRMLGAGQTQAWASDSWCAWTTFSSLESNLNYWQRGLPSEHELLEICTIDGGLWRQSFHYSDLAHIIVPATFSWEKLDSNGFTAGKKHQDIAALSNELTSVGIKHRLTNLLLEVKLY